MKMLLPFRRRRPFTLETIFGFTLIAKSVLILSVPPEMSFIWFTGLLHISFAQHWFAPLLLVSGWLLAWFNEVSTFWFVLLSLPALLLPFVTLIYGLVIINNPIPGYTMMTFWLVIMYAHAFWRGVRTSWTKESELP